MKHLIRLTGIILCISLAPSAAIGQQPIVYPAKGQTPEQQQKDTAECNGWAKQTTGIDPVALAQRPAALPAAGVEEAQPEQKPAIMVVDDSITVRRVTQRLLEREGYRVMLAKDGVDALEQIEGQRPDLMLVDIEMPRMDGFDLTRELRSREATRAIPIIMITSRTADKHRNVALGLGVNAYFGKPYQEPVLLAAIESLLDKAKS